MNMQQRTTVKALFLAVLILFLVGVLLLVAEGHAVAAGGHSTISEILQYVWAKQPWTIFLASHLVAAPVWFLLGHFLAQNQDVYERMRKDGL